MRIEIFTVLTLLCMPCIADERADAAAFLNETLKCPPPNEQRRDEGLAIVYSSENRPSSTAAEPTRVSAEREISGEWGNLISSVATAGQ